MSKLSKKELLNKLKFHLQIYAFILQGKGQNVKNQNVKSLKIDQKFEKDQNVKSLF